MRAAPTSSRTADGRGVGSGVKRLGIGVREFKELAVDAADLVHGLLALSLAGLNHERLVDDGAGSTSWAVQAKVEHALGKVERGDARLLVEIDKRHDELVHADLVIGHGELLRELHAHIVGVEHGVLRRLGDALPAQRQQ